MSWEEDQERARGLSDEELADFLSIDDLRAFRDKETGKPLVSPSDFVQAGYFPGVRTDVAAIHRAREYEDRQKREENPATSPLRQLYYENLGNKYREILAPYPPRSSPHIPRTDLTVWNTEISDMIEEGLKTSKSSGKSRSYSAGGSVYKEKSRKIIGSGAAIRGRDFRGIY